MDDPVPRRIHEFERALGIGLLVHEVDPGPPFTIRATALVDGGSNPIVGQGLTEDEAWRELAVAMAAWRNVDPRQVRMIFGGG